MIINRRKFTKLSLLGGASLATSSGIFFPKPAEAFSLDFLVSKASVQDVFRNLLTYAGIKVIDRVFAPSVQTEIDTTQQKLKEKGFDQNKTQYGQVDNTNVMWGQERQESQQSLGLDVTVPNPAFAIQNTKNFDANPAVFTASTTIGIDRASIILAQQQRLPQEQVNDLLIPWQEVFEDITSWQGDKDPTIGSNSNVGLTRYRSRRGVVIRRYERVSPEIGMIYFKIESSIFNGTINTKVKFV